MMLFHLSVEIGQYSDGPVIRLTQTRLNGRTGEDSTILLSSEQAEIVAVAIMGAGREIKEGEVSESYLERT